MAVSEDPLPQPKGAVRSAQAAAFNIGDLGPFHGIVHQQAHIPWQTHAGRRSALLLTYVLKKISVSTSKRSAAEKLLIKRDACNCSEFQTPLYSDEFQRSMGGEAERA
nr:hypothetical protein Iba_chr05cCG7130 [Ipomoea batatas]